MGRIVGGEAGRERVNPPSFLPLTSSTLKNRLRRHTEVAAGLPTDTMAAERTVLTSGD